MRVADTRHHKEKQIFLLPSFPEDAPQEGERGNEEYVDGKLFQAEDRWIVLSRWEYILKELYKTKTPVPCILPSWDAIGTFRERAKDLESQTTTYIFTYIAQHLLTTDDKYSM